MTERNNWYVDLFNQDIEQYRASSLFSVDIKQLSRGSFNGRTTIITLPGCTLIRRVAEASHATQGYIPASAFLLFPLCCRDAFSRGRVRGGNQQIGSLGAHELIAVSPENYSYLMVTFPLETLAEHLSPSEACLFIETLATIENGFVDPHLKEATTACLVEIFDAIERSPVPLTVEALRAFSQQVVHVLFVYLAVHSGSEPVRSSNHEKILQRALNLIVAHPEQSFTLDVLAREVFASKRAVQYAFTSVLGLSPMRFQKLYRLNLVRNDLRDPRSPAKFAGIVSKYSFTNAARASREYAELFGERPTQTLRNARSSAATHVPALMSCASRRQRTPSAH